METLNLVIGMTISFGGSMGYIKKGSLHSIISGSIIGAIYLISAYYIKIG